ncbi:MAG: hypothetical protein Crog4KO_21700 [Crocinitomicaceae bacterium]
MQQFNKYLGWILTFMNSLTLIAYVAFSHVISSWAFLLLIIVCPILLLFLLTGYSSTRDRKSNPKSVDIAIWLGRIFLVICLLASVMANNEAIYMSPFIFILGVLSFLFRRYKEVQVLVLNTIGLVICGMIAFGGLTGMLDSV